MVSETVRKLGNSQREMIKTTHSGREHDKKAVHDESEADADDELGHKRLDGYAGPAGRGTKRRMEGKSI